MNAIPQHTQEDSVIGLLKEVMMYSRGRGRYNFTHMIGYQRSDAITEAWDALEKRIVKKLAECGEKV